MTGVWRIGIVMRLLWPSGRRRGMKRYVSSGTRRGITVDFNQVRDLLTRR